MELQSRTLIIEAGQLGCSLCNYLQLSAPLGGSVHTASPVSCSNPLKLLRGGAVDTNRND